MWPEVWPWLESAVAYGQGDEDVNDVAVAIYNARYELWHEPGKFAAVSELAHHPRQNVATILYAGGDLDAFREHFDEAKELARKRGASALRIWGRAGWEKVFGMKRIGIILQVPL